MFDAESSKGRGSRFQLGTSSNSRSFEIESWSYVQHKNYNLQVMQKIQQQSTRPKIPATRMQRLTYFRTLSSLSHKTLVISMQYLNFQGFVWNCIITLIFKSLPSTYIYIFLASYAADEHFYLPKMVPLSYGCKIAIIIATYMDLIVAGDSLSRYADYLIKGILESNPWNRCHNNESVYKETTIVCLKLPEFIKRVEAGGAENNMFYLTDADGNFQLSQVLYSNLQTYPYFFKKHFSTPLSFYFVFVWIIAAMHYKMIHKKFLWTALNYVHWLLVFLFFATLCHLIWIKLEMEIPPLLLNLKNSTKHNTIRNMLRKMDLDFLAETVTSRPVIHMLTARSGEEISPGRDSGILQLSNVLYFIFKGLVTSQLKKHCDSLTRMPIEYSYISSFPWFYLWPLYFANYEVGDLLSLFFFSLAFLNEIFAFIISFQCLAEALNFEFLKLKMWMTSIFLVISAAVFVAFTDFRNRFILNIYSSGVITLCEMLVMIYLYPMDRLRDDVTFQFGNPPSTCRMWSLRLAPLYYGIKLYMVLSSFIEFSTAYRPFSNGFPEYYWIWAIFFIPLVLGFFYAIFSLVIRRRQNWRALLRPIPQWGPRDHVQRQLRKQFDSREYITSQSSRYLSRYLMSKSEAQSYKLDICYDKGGRRSTVIHDAFKYDNEKKLV